MNSENSYSVEDLALKAAISVDTIRYYQGLGLISPPQKNGRRAIYGNDHISRLEEIKKLAFEGFSLRQISLLKEERLDGNTSDDLKHLIAEDTKARSLSRSEVAEKASVPESLVALLCDNGLLQPLFDDEEPRFDESSVSMVEAGIAIANAGVPLEELVSLAQHHSSNVDEVVDRAIGLFEEHIKEGTGASSEKDLAVVIKDLLPSVIRLVAQHFHKSLVTRSLERIDGHNKTILSNALIASDPENLVVTCEWR
jgi:DNA-binding transcriptional MerR regulator